MSLLSRNLCGGRRHERALVLAAAQLVLLVRVAVAQPAQPDTKPPEQSDDAAPPAADRNTGGAEPTVDSPNPEPGLVPVVAPTPPPDKAVAPPVQAANTATPSATVAHGTTPSARAENRRAEKDDARIVSALHGYVQAEYLRRDISVDELSAGTGAPLNENKFGVRRARVLGRSDWRWAGVAGEVELFGAGAVARPIAAEVHAQYAEERDKPPLVGIRAGLIPVPFGFENYEQSHLQRFFGEQALFSHGFVPGRFDMGVGLFGHVWSLNWALAAQNGQPVAAADFAYQDPNAAKDIAARVQVRRDVVSNFNAAVALSLLEGRGFSPGTQPTKTTFDWRDLNEDGRVAVSELVPNPGSAGRASKSFRRWAVGADLQLRTTLPVIGDLMVYGEAALGVNMDRVIAPADPVLLGRDQRGLGWYVGIVQNVTRYFAVGARYEQYEPNIDALDQFGGNAIVARRKFKTLSVGISANVSMPRDMRGRVLLEYEHQKNSLGRDARGLPANLDNDTLRARMEVAF